MADSLDTTEPIHIMGAGLSGLAAATILAKAGKEVHVHDVRANSGARFDGDFQALENWSMDVDFFDQLKSWGFDASEFQATEFQVVDLIHPDDVITQPQSDRVAYRIVERGTSDHTIDQGMKRQALEAGAKIHYKSRVKEEDCTIIACGPKGTSAVAYGEIFKTSHPNHIAFQLNDKLAPGAYSYLIIVDGVGLICTCLWRKQSKSERFLNETIAWYEKHYPNLDRTQSSVLEERVISPSINATNKTVVITSGNQGAFRISCGVLACVWRFGLVFWLHKIFLANAITKLKFANNCFLMFAQVLRTVGS